MTSMLPELNLADNLGIRETKLPREAILDTTPASSLPATKKIVNLVPITNNSVRSNQTVQFLIPQRNLAKAHSFYLKFKFNLEGAAAYGAGTYSAPNYNAPSDRFYSFAGSSGSAGALFQQMTVQAGGTTIEACQNYHIWHNNVICHAQDQNAAAKVESITAGAYLADLPWAKQQNVRQVSSGTNPVTRNLGTGGGLLPNISKFEFTDQFSAKATDSSAEAMTLSIPLQMGFFNPKEAQLLPLFAFNGGVLLTLQTNAIQKALYWSSSAFDVVQGNPVPPLRDDGAAGGTTVTNSGAFNLCTDYLLSDFELCYTEITPAPAYIASTQAALQAGRQIRIECQSYNQYNVACQSSVRQNFNANMSSLAAIFWGRVNGVDSLTTKKWFQGQLTPQGGQPILDGNAQQRYEVYLDNVQLFQSPNQLNMISVVARQLQEALCSSITDHPVSAYVQGPGISAGDGYGIGTYIEQAYLYGLSTKLFASNSTSFDGTQVSTITLNFQTPDDASSNTWYMFLVYDYIYMVDATGSVSKLM